jgi:ketosteroid isomerase-like protein
MQLGGARMIVFLVLANLALGQSQSPAQWLEEINRDIWKPFLSGVAKNDEALYLNVHSKEYVRVQAEGRLILSSDTYVDDTKTMMARYKSRGTDLTMDVRFEERIVNGEFASERGVSKVVFATKGAAPTVYYGRFHTISRKENGKWKIVSDYFPPASESVVEADFVRAKAMDDVTRFGCYMRYPGKTLDCAK